MESRMRKRRMLLQAPFALAAWAAAPTTGLAREKPVDTVSLLQFRPQSGNDWTAAFNLAVSLARRVHVPAGEYLLTSADWPPDTEIFGDGDQSVLRMPADAAYLITNDSGSPSPTHNIRRLHMHDLQLRGSCDTDGMSEFRHLLSLNGVSDVRFERVLFRGFRGDGLYLGSGNRGDSERHNTDVKVINCRFDGINRENRNGISVIDCDGLLVEGCRFRDLTRRNMPGAIDIEPNRKAWHVVRNIHIRRNRFQRVGGNAGVISVYVPAVTPLPRRIVVEENIGEQYLGTGSFFHYNDNRAPGTDTPPAGILLHRNDARDGVSGFALMSGKGIVLSANRFRDFSRPALIGHLPATLAVSDLTLVGNLMERCGSAGASAITVHRADGLLFASNRFVDAGNPGVPAASAVLFADGCSSAVVFEDNQFESRSRRRLIAIRKDPAHVMDTSRNRFGKNRLNGLANFFQTAS